MRRLLFAALTSAASQDAIVFIRWLWRGFGAMRAVGRPAALCVLFWQALAGPWLRLLCAMCYVGPCGWKRCGEGVHSTASIGVSVRALSSKPAKICSKIARLAACKTLVIHVKRSNQPSTHGWLPANRSRAVVELPAPESPGAAAPRGCPSPRREQPDAEQVRAPTVLSISDGARHAASTCRPARVIL